jgi:hypothetical protein
MTDTQAPKRRFWQIHLSTAVVMMVVASVCLFVNLQWRFSESSTYSSADDVPGEIQIQGWPFAAQKRFWGYGREWYRQIEGYGLVADAVCMFVVVAGVATLSEYLIRRRSKP